MYNKASMQVYFIIFYEHIFNENPVLARKYHGAYALAISQFDSISLLKFLFTFEIFIMTVIICIIFVILLLFDYYSVYNKMVAAICSYLYIENIFFKRAWSLKILSTRNDRIIHICLKCNLIYTKDLKLQNHCKPYLFSYTNSEI